MAILTSLFVVVVLRVDERRSGTERHRWSFPPRWAAGAFRAYATPVLARQTIPVWEMVAEDEAMPRGKAANMCLKEPRLGWRADVTFPQLVSMMVQADLEWVERQQHRDRQRQ